jgi:hypothetical protein
VVLTRTRWPFAVLIALAIVLSGCGSSNSSSHATTAATTSSTSTSTANPPPAVSELPAAEHPSAVGFPTPQGRTLQQLANLAKSTAQLGAATGTFVPGSGRFAFALTTNSGDYVYAPTVLYIGKTPGSPAQGPFLAPDDPMTVAPQYQSKQNAGPGGIQAIYESHVPLPQAGTYDVLALTRGPHGLIGSTGEIAVASSSPIPNVGQRPPAIMTDTLASVHGDVSLLTTRQPPEQMHSVSLNQVLGKQPVALLFSTPQFCTSRVCGPVTDIAVSLQHEYAGRITFIHQEVYADNQPTKGLRTQMKAFHLETEPWLFTVNRQGIIAARLEGAYGVNAMRQALNAALS